MQLKRVFSLADARGTKNYIDSQKKYEIARTLLYFAISVSLFVAGVIQTGDRANILSILQVLDDGRITDAHGRTVNFENTVIVMTTNAGSSTKVGSVGFGRTANEQGKDRAMKALNDFLRPEFINRVDEIVYFNQLSEDNFKGIAVLMLKELVGTLKEKDINFTWDETLLDYLVKKSYSAAYGARNLRRQIQKDLEDPIAAKLIQRYANPVTMISLSAAGETLNITTD